MKQLYFQRFARVFSYFLLLVPLVIFPYFPEPFLTPKVLWLLLGIDLVAVGLLLGGRRSNSAETASTLRMPLLFLAASIYVLVLFIATIVGVAGPEGLYWGTFLRANGLFVFVHAMCGGLLLAFVLPTKEHWQNFLRTTIVIAGVVVLIGFIGRIFPTIAFIGNPGNMHGTFGNSGFFAGYLLLHLAVCAMVFSMARSKRERVWLIGLFLFLCVGLVFTQSRAATLGLVIGLLVLLISSWRVITRRVRVAVVLIVVLFMLAQFVPVQWLPRGITINPTAITSQTRLLYWNIAWDAFQEHPILGWGRGGYATAFAKYFDPTIQSISFGDIFTDDSHNLFLNTVVESGVIGLLALLFLLGMICWYAIRSIAHAQETRDAWCMRVALAAVVAYGVYSFFSVEQPIVSFFFWMIVGYIYWYSCSVSSVVGFALPWLHESMWIKRLGWAVLFVSIVLTATVSKDMFTFVATARAQNRSAWFTWAQALEQIPEGGWRVYHCEWWMYSVRSFLSPALHGRLASDVAIRVASALEKPIDGCTAHGTHFYRTNLAAQFYTRVGDLRTETWYKKAVEMYQKTLVLSPNNVQVSYGLAEVYLSLGESEKAIALLEERRTAYPEIAQTYWYLSLAYNIHKEPEKAEEARREAVKHGFVPPVN